MITPIVGRVYVIHHTSGNIKAKFLEHKVYNPSFGGSLRGARSTHQYHFENLATGRVITLKSKAKIVREVEVMTSHPGLMQYERKVVQAKDPTCVLCDAGEEHEH